MIPFQIKKLSSVPSEFRKRRQEADLLWYGSSEILVGVHGRKIAGSIRVCREVSHPSHGILTDLFFDNALKTTLPFALIQSGEHLLQEKGVSKLSSLVIDGRGLVGPFTKSGYEPVRRTVFLTWDLKNLPTIEINPSLVVKTFARPTSEILRFIHDSYQPYWVPWKGKSADELRRMVWSGTRFFAVYHKGRIVGLTDTFFFGPMMRRGATGRKIGSTVMAAALQWLQDQGRSKAHLTTTSGLDDYDPVVYLTTMSTGAAIEKEHIILEKAPIRI